MDSEVIVKSLSGCYPYHIQAVLLCSRHDFDDTIRAYVAEIVKKPGFNWYEFLGISMIERVNGVVYSHIKDMKGIPAFVLYFLKMAYNQQVQRTNSHKEEIKAVSDLFKENSVRHAFLKGAVLNTVVYNPGERISNDTDILVHVEDIDKAVKLLSNAGYIQGGIKNGEIIPATKREIIFSRINTYEIVPLIKKLDLDCFPFHEVDVNFKLGNDSTQEEAVELLKSVLTVDKEGYYINTLPIEDFLLFLCIHHYREAIMVYKIVNGDDLTLYKFMDIHFLVSSRDVDWNKLHQKTVDMNRVKDVYYTLYYAEKLYPGTIPQDVMELFRPDDCSFLNEYRGRDNSDEVYSWKTDFEHRLFSYNRQLEALENIEDESNRFNEILSEIKKK